MESAVFEAVTAGARTKDLGGNATTVSAADEILARLVGETTTAA